jgi:hypothetical protein
MARYGSVLSEKYEAVCLLVKLLEAFVVLYYLRDLRYVIDNAYVTSNLAVDFGTGRANALISLGHLSNVQSK